VEKPNPLAISVNLTQALPRSHTPPACSAKLAEPGHRREDRKEVYPGVNEGQLGNTITNVATAIGAGVGPDRVIRRASCVPNVGVHGHGDDIECSQGGRRS
jgi:hypothetical protein